jgi:hypothetical protein
MHSCRFRTFAFFSVSCGCIDVVVATLLLLGSEQMAVFGTRVASPQFAVGMTKDDLIKNLGTIAKSGTSGMTQAELHRFCSVACVG